MGMPDLAKRWTRDEVLALPDDGNRYELVDGELLVSPSPRPIHQLAVSAGIPLLVVEVLSPSTARFDRVTKRRRFQRSRVPTYWIVDIDARLVEVWTPDDRSPVIAEETLHWQPDPGVPPLAIDLPGCFREILG
jgi:Uma2 family endonuclease